MKHQREQYKDSISLKSHQRYMCEGGKYSCNICGFQTTTKNKLQVKILEIVKLLKILDIINPIGAGWGVL